MFFVETRLHQVFSVHSRFLLTSCYFANIITDTWAESKKGRIIDSTCSHFHQIGAYRGQIFVDYSFLVGLLVLVFLPTYKANILTSYFLYVTK